MFDEKMTEDEVLMREILRVLAESGDEVDLVKEWGYVEVVRGTIKAALEKYGLIMDVKTACQYTVSFLVSCTVTNLLKGFKPM